MFQSYLTGIEIQKRNIGVRGAPVPIVPYWNWNKFGTCPQCVKTKFQSYLTGIEIYLSVALWSCSFRFQSYLTGIEIVNGDIQWDGLWVPIVPYWNWNLAGLLCVMRMAKSSNRTLLELKLISSGVMYVRIMFQSYLTGIEMRLQLWQQKLGQGSNRTLLELKYLFDEKSSKNLGVPIVPYWNWNIKGRQRQPSKARSNRTLLELKYVGITYSARGRVFQSYLTGIEMAHPSVGRVGQAVPIVPYWNWNDKSILEV